jgi:hypothetical protein
MTPHQLAEIEARLKAATPGKWYEGYRDGSGKYKPCTCEKDSFCIVAQDAKPVSQAIIHADLFSKNYADVQLIANAPQDLALLIGEVRRLQGEIGKCNEAHTERLIRIEELREGLQRVNKRSQRAKEALESLKHHALANYPIKNEFVELTCRDALAEIQAAGGGNDSL